MKKWITLALTLLIMPTLFILSSQRVSADELDVTVTYKVQKGDSLYKIAKKTNNTVAILMKANKLSSDKLVVGQVLEAPIKSKEVFANLTGMNYEEMVAVNAEKTSKLSIADMSKQQDKAVIYQVKQGDTIDSISRKLKVNIQNVIEANPEIKDPNFIFIGQKVRVPQN
ncbi:LysM domain-containing protein [Aneurinibacillus soli]|uniref:Putative cell wall hydrolase LytN n=1 Tax=Aneurinibacillus soli TaxID=1500254 RepID=A0A0U5C6N4_9BACL|nr:LysM peptidoglycan-binding domain-containing protein [Aneurinibacillus soli]PYE61376.1 LysM domain-containing protein [Aneurinibacillus soli]BAU27795.1 putative cell wall hydrolase LytN precursor [Aneurinibacillus soli]